MARKPLSTVAAERILTVRMTDHDYALLNALVAARNVERAETGDDATTAAGYLRSLIRREAKAKGIAVAVPEVAKAVAAPSAAPVMSPATNKEAANLHARLLRAIEAGNESQASIARRAGVDPASLSRFASTGKGLSEAKRKGLEKALGKH